MNIVFIGTSNSVMALKGLIRALKLEHNITQLSVGRVPFYYHIKAILENIELINESDIVIIDHYINDINFYLELCGDDYHHIITDFYKLLSSINTHVINLFFPIQNLNGYKQYHWYQKLINLSHESNISVIDLNNLELQAKDFKDPIHITDEISYFVGIFLLSHLNNYKFLNKPHHGNHANLPFKLIKFNQYHTHELHENQLKIFSNSLMHIEYLDLINPITLRMSPRQKLLSIGYINPKDKEGLSGIYICNTSEKYLFALEGRGYFHEVLLPQVHGDVQLKPFTGEAELPDLAGRTRVKGHFSSPFLVDALLYATETNFVVTPSEKSTIVFSAEQCKQALIYQQSLSMKVSAKTVDFLRDYATSIENTDIELAYDLMRLAQQQRPYGPFINNKVTEYKNSLNKTDKS